MSCTHFLRLIVSILPPIFQGVAGHVWRAKGALADLRSNCHIFGAFPRKGARRPGVSAEGLGKPFEWRHNRDLVVALIRAKHEELKQ